MTNKVIETTGKTIEEAIRKGLEELKVSREEVEIQVLQEPKTGGILGILSQKPAKVRISYVKKVSRDVLNATKQKIEEILTNIFKITNDTEMKFSCSGDDKQILVNLHLEDPKRFIGYKGKNLEALQSLLNSILQQEDEEYAKVFVEMNDYKKEKEAKLRAFSRKMASNVVKFGKPIKLEPMTAYERLIIHKELADNEDVTTESIGKEPKRRVVIKKKNRY